MIKVNRKQKIILAVGGGFIAILWALSFIVKQTSWLDRPAGIYQQSCPPVMPCEATS